jgi:hypothetical protein
MPAGSRPRKSCCFSVHLKAGGRYTNKIQSQLEVVSQKELPLHCRGRDIAFDLFGSSNNWKRPIHIKEGKMLYSVYGFKC